MNKILRVVAGVVFGLVMLQTPAHAVILNYGVDIFTNGSFSVLPFYDISDSGKTLKGGITGVSAGQTYTLSLNTKSKFHGYKINSASLFIDAVAIGSDDNGQVRVQGALLGELADTKHSVTRVPLIGGGTAHTPEASDVDNSFFALPDNLASQLATDSTYHISFHNADFNSKKAGPNNFRVDGINLQVDATAIPEPGSLLLFGLGSLGAIGFLGRRKRHV